MSFEDQCLHSKHINGININKSARFTSLECTGRQVSDLLTPGQKPAKLLKLLNPYLENRLRVTCVQSFFRVN